MVETKKEKVESGNAFEEFLKAAENYFQNIVSGINKTVGEHEDSTLIASHGEALNAQVRKVLDYTRLQFQKSNLETQRLTVEFCEYQAVTQMAEGGSRTFNTSVSKAVFGGGIFSWLEANAEEIKKIINEIWEIFGSVPEWFEALKQVIDQILKLLLSLFGGILGFNRTKISAELSNMEVQFWNELTARRRFVNTLKNSDNEVED